VLYLLAIVWSAVTGAIVGGVAAGAIYLITGQNGTYASVAFWLVAAVSFLGRLLASLSSAHLQTQAMRLDSLSRSSDQQQPDHVVWLHDGTQKVLFFRDAAGKPSWRFEPPPVDGFSGQVMSVAAQTELTRQQLEAGISPWFPPKATD
jgi:hypothetical protein